MRHCDVRTPAAALVYLADCTLATVISLAMKKSRPVGEYRRQISIAQSAVDWIRAFGLDAAGTRVERVTTTVADYAKEYEPLP